MSGRYDPATYRPNLSGFAAADQYQPPVQKKSDPLEDILRMASAAAPAVGTGLGALVGGIAGGGALSAPGAMAGAGIGGAIGSGLGALGNAGADQMGKGRQQQADAEQARQDERRAREQAVMQMMMSMH